MMNGKHAALKGSYPCNLTPVLILTVIISMYSKNHFLIVWVMNCL